MDLLDKLSKEKLRQPKGLKQFIFHHTSYQTRTWGRYHCVETMEKWNGTWILRVFAYKQMPKGQCTYRNIKTMEVQRVILGYKEYLATTNAYNTAMSGRYILWDDDVAFFRCKRNWEFYGYEMFDTQEVIDDLNIPYCSWDQFKKDRGYLRFIEYISLYIKEPRIERLVKLGLSQYLTGIRYLDLSKRRIYDVFKLNKKWEFVIGEFEMTDILILRNVQNQIKNLDYFDYYKTMYKNRWGPKNIKKITMGAEFKTINYLVHQSEIIENHHIESYYDDYLGFADELGYDTKRNKVLYPENLHKAHDKLMKQHRKLQKERERQKIEANNSKFAEQFKKNKKHVFAGFGFIIAPAKTQDELIKESKVLNHCVRTYADSVADGSTEILLLRKETEPDNPFITVEVRGKTIRQARGKNNSAPSEEVKLFLMKWAHKNKIQYV